MRDVIDEPLSYIDRWLKMMMKEVLMVIKMGAELTENINNTDLQY
jgi:hypothetical protein